MTGPTKTTAETSAAEAKEVGSTAVQSGQQVAASAGEQAGQVADEVRRQANDLYGQVRSQASEQVRAGQQRAGDGLRALATELQQMSGGDNAGPVSDLAAQAGDKLDELAGWLDRHEAGDLVDEVRSFARRRPGVFLGGAAAAGLLLGRLTRGVVDGSSAPEAPAPPTAAPPVAPPPVARPQAAPPVAPSPVTRPPVAPPPVTAPGAPPPGAPQPMGVAQHHAQALPPDVPAPEPASDATTVGEYIDQVERGTPPWSEQHGDAGGSAR